MTTKTLLILNEVAKERESQHSKWGEQNHDPAKYMLILTEEVGEAAMDANEIVFRQDKAAVARYRKELVQVAAVAVAMIEAVDRGMYE